MLSKFVLDMKIQNNICMLECWINEW